MAVKFGGIYGGSGENERRMRTLLGKLQRVAGVPGDDDYVVDLAFCTYVANRRPAYIDWDGVKAGPVGRTQRRFVVWIEVPPDLAHAGADACWMAGVLTEAARLVREHLPRRSSTYPVARLEHELLAVQAALTD